MTWVTLTNAFTVACGLVMLWATIGIYRLTRARSAFWLMAAIAYIVAARTLISISEAHAPGSAGAWPASHASFVIVPFWPLMATGMVLLLRSLRRAYRVDRRRRQTGDYKGPERRRTPEGD